MAQALITIRDAKEADAQGIAEVHDSAWRHAYSGIIPGQELERMIARRGPAWWHSAIVRGSRLLVLDFDELIGGYASYGRNRVPAMAYGGEIFELYISPEFQGLGFGQRMFSAARKDLAEHGYSSFLVWALADNEGAVAFYRHLGGRIVRRAYERFSTELRERVAFAFE